MAYFCKLFEVFDFLLTPDMAKGSPKVIAVDLYSILLALLSTEQNLKP
jgi:hypothetical protein